MAFGFATFTFGFHCFLCIWWSWSDFSYPEGQDLYEFKLTIHQKANVKVLKLQSIWFLRRGSIFFSLSLNYLLFVWDLALHLNKLKRPFPQGCFMLRLVEFGLAVLEKKIKMWKGNDDNDDDRRRTNFDQKSLIEPSAQVN